VGNDTALASADVVLIAGELSPLPEFFSLCRRTLGIIRQNIAFAVAVKLALVGFALAGVLPLWGAVLGDVGTTVLVILNGMRLLS
jgi:Cd2+/Zn2+-exporting ATPase